MVTPSYCPFDTNGDGNCGRPLCPYCGPLRMQVLHPLLLRVIATLAADVWDSETLVQHVNRATVGRHEMVAGALMRLIAEQFDYSSINGDGSYTPARFLEHLHTVMGYSHLMLLKDLRDLASEVDPHAEERTYGLARRSPADRLK